MEYSTAGSIGHVKHRKYFTEGLPPDRTIKQEKEVSIIQNISESLCMWRMLFYKTVLTFFKTDKMKHHKKSSNI